MHVSDDRLDAGAIAVRGGPLLSQAEAIKFTKLPAEVLFDNPLRTFHAVPVGPRFFFFQDELLELLAFLETRNP